MTAPPSKQPDVVVVGGGIIGLSTAMTVARSARAPRVLVLEKEPQLGLHQTGHSSGVIHSGIYYRPGSIKARLAVEGSRAMVAFCREHGIAHEVCGKVIIATEPEELPRLEALHQRGIENGVEGLALVEGERLRELEPHVAGLRAVHVPSAGIADYQAVARRYAELLREAGGEVRTGCRYVRATRSAGGRWAIDTSTGTVTARVLVTCGGLYADRVTRAAGTEPPLRIVPFRGEYYDLRPEVAARVRGLVYPVPDPGLPFLGVHLTRHVGGRVDAGPNAVLAFRREGYRWRDVSARDLADTLTYAGFWRLARKHWRTGIYEVRRSLSKGVFLASLQRLMPSLRLDDLTPAPAGVRAQALLPDGGLADDFRIESVAGGVHVLNAPSPAATASLPIGRVIAERVDAVLG